MGFPQLTGITTESHALAGGWSTQGEEEQGRDEGEQEGPGARGCGSGGLGG